MIGPFQIMLSSARETITLKADGMKVTQPRDPYPGPRYTEPVTDAMERDFQNHIYSLTAGRREDYVNPTADGSVSWRSIHSF